MEVLRGHKRSLRYAATFYRLAASKGSKNSKINLVYLSKEGSEIIFVGDSEQEYTKVFDKAKDTKTFIQIFNGVKTIEKEDRNAYKEKYKEGLAAYTNSCVISLQKDLDMLEKEKEDLIEYFSIMPVLTKDKDTQDSIYAWAEVEERVIKGEMRLLKPVLKKFSNLNKRINKEKGR